MAHRWTKAARAGLAALALCALLPLGAGAAPAGVTIWGYQEGMAKAQSPDGKFGYANARREVVIPMQYTSVLDFTLGLGQVQLGDRLGVIRQDGTYLIQPEYGSLFHMTGGLYIAQKGTKWGVVSLLPFPDGKGGTTEIFYDFVYDSARLTEVSGGEALLLTKDGETTVLPFYQINQLMLERQVPSARFPLNRGRLPDFSDVSHRSWYDLWVDLAYNLELMEGVGDNRFAPDRTMTVAEAVRLAACMESRQRGDNFHQQSVSGAVWYRSSVDYCVASGILRRGEFLDYERPVTRAEMAHIFASTSLGRAIPEKNSLERVKASVPDVKAGDYAADDIYALYAKGVLAGSDGKLTFRPGDTVTRAEAAGIAARMARMEQRITLF